MNPLNPFLYKALQQFGEVRISDPGVELVATYIQRPDGRVRMGPANFGEYYRISCPYCGDTRFRLYINHRWGVYDERTRTRNRWLAHCYNENCLANKANLADLIEQTSWYHREARARRVQIQKGRVEPVGNPIPLPEDFIGLDKLPRAHPARRYAEGRAFDPDVLARDWRVGYSEEACCLHRNGSLMIPIYRIENGNILCWGWQARAIDPEDEERCKYFTARGFKKSQFLYGLDNATGGTGPVLIFEGVTDVWRAGRNAVALLGKMASDEQIKLVKKHFCNRPLVVGLDPDAVEDAQRLAEKLRQARALSILKPDTSPVVVAILPDDQDPGDCTREDLWSIAEHALAQAESTSKKRR